MSEADLVNVYIENLKKALFEEITKHLIVKSQFEIASKQLEEATAKLEKLEAKSKKTAE